MPCPLLSRALQTGKNTPAAPGAEGTEPEADSTATQDARHLPRQGLSLAVPHRKTDRAHTAAGPGALKLLQEAGYPQEKHFPTKGERLTLEPGRLSEGQRQTEELGKHRQAG